MEIDRKYKNILYGCPYPPQFVAFCFPGRSSLWERVQSAFVITLHMAKVICSVDLNPKNSPGSQAKNNGETPYYGNKVSSWMQLVNSVPWTLGFIFLSSWHHVSFASLVVLGASAHVGLLRIGIKVWF